MSGSAGAAAGAGASEFEGFPNKWLAETDRDEHRLVVHGLRAAAETGLPGILSRVLAPDARMLIDAGSDSAIGARTSEGAVDVTARFTAVLASDVTGISEHDVNGRAGLVLRRAGRVTGIVSVNARGGLVTELWIVLNPDKLRHWNE